jgi:hypothetical protein
MFRSNTLPPSSGPKIKQEACHRQRLLFFPEDGGSMLSLNIGELLSDYMALLRRESNSSNRQKEHPHTIHCIGCDCNGFFPYSEQKEFPILHLCGDLKCYKTPYWACFHLRYTRKVDPSENGTFCSDTYALNSAKRAGKQVTHDVYSHISQICRRSNNTLSRYRPSSHNIFIFNFLTFII